MRKALVVDCCIRKDRSRTRVLLDAFVSGLGPDIEKETIVLDEENLGYFSGEFFRQRERLLSEGKLDHPRFRYAHQFAEADIIVVAAPFWDLSFPALLKVYIENVSVDGITFSSGHGGINGICRATDLVFLTTRGGIYSADDPMEMGGRYMEALSRFFGIGSYSCIAADGTDMSSVDTGKAIEEACGKARALAASL